MKYFIDTEFIEGSQKGFLHNTKPTIDLISIGIVSEDERKYYAISKDFNLKEAWNRFDLKEANTSENHSLNNIKVYWIRDNVLKPIMIELQVKYNKESGKALNGWKYNDFKYLINKYGKTNKQIAKEVKEFCSIGCAVSRLDNLGNCINWKIRTAEVNKFIKDNDCKYIFDEIPSFYGYYSDYDWVVFCWLFGKMIDLPKGFPMYCIDLKQELDRYILRSKAKYLPKQTNEHNALADARWNKELYEFLNTI